MTSLDLIVSKLFVVAALASPIFWARLINGVYNDSKYNAIKFWCSNTEIDPQTSYRSNLHKLLSSLSEIAGQSTNNGYYATNSTTLGASDSEIVYGLFLCRGDTTHKDCQGCVSTAITTLPPATCPRAKGAVVWYDNCMVRYSNESFLRIVDEDIRLGWKNDDNMISITKKDADESMILGCVTLFELAFELSSTKPRLVREGIMKYYSTRDVVYNSSLKISTMAQCSPDLTLADCGKCLRLIINEMSTFCNGSKSVWMLNPSCNTRCEIYRHYQNVASPLQPPLPSLSPTPVAKGNSKKRTFLLISLPTSAAISILFSYGVWICVRNRKAMKTTYVEVSQIKKAVDSLQFDFHKIRTATRNFATDNKLGEGGFGEVYKGKLENGQDIAVKRLSEKSGQGAAEFKTEVVLVAKLQHKNLVKLLGFCVALKEKILVYEFLPNSSLDRFLFDQIKKASLDWKIRFKIIIGVARGLLYLHEDSPLKVIHRDLKSSNILLDEDMNPKISDFGLAKLFGVNQTQGDTNRIVGTYGYMAPEYAITGHYSVKSDIYSFGVIVLEIVSGQRSNFFQGFKHEEALLYRAWGLWNGNKALDLVDAALSNDFSEEEVMKCIHIGLLCIQEYAVERPIMTSIVAALSGQSISLPIPKAPHFIGTISNSKDEQLFTEHSSTYVYTGTRTVTDLYPRN